MADRKTTLSPRKEGTRDKNEIETREIPVQFELNEIKKHFYDSLSDIEKQVDIANNLNDNGQTQEAKDIWRAQIVYIEGIMDFYLHELSKYAFVRMFSGKWEKTASYADFKIPMSDIEKGLKSPESTDWLFERINIRFGSETYLQSKTVSQQLSLIGLSLDEICKKAFPKTNGEVYVKGQNHMDNLFQRRNQIAHQADRKHSTAEKEDIDQAFVQNAINFVTKLVEAIHAEALMKEND